MKFSPFLLALIASAYIAPPALATFTQNIPSIPRAAGGAEFTYTFPSEDTPAKLTLSAANFNVRIHSLVLRLESGESLDLLPNFARDSAGRVFVYANQSNTLSIEANDKIVALSVVAESYGGSADLNLDLGISNGPSRPIPAPIPLPPPPPPMPPRLKTVICAAVDGGYQPTYLETGVRIGQGYYFKQDDCEAAISFQRKGLICSIAISSNGGAPSLPTDVATGEIIGNYGSFDVKVCVRQMETAYRDLICLVGPTSPQGALYNWKTKTFIDQNYRSMDSCVESLDSLGARGRPGPGNGRPGEGSPEFPRPNLPGPVEIKLISEADAQALINVVRGQHWDENRYAALKPYIDNIASRKQSVSMDTLIKLVKLYTWDEGRIALLSLIKPVLVVELAKIQNVEASMSFRSNVPEVKRILLSK